MRVTLGSYDFSTPSQIVFGWGRRHELGQWTQRLGSRVFVIPGSKTLTASAFWSEIIAQLDRAGRTVMLLPNVEREPLVEDVDRYVGWLRDARLATGDWLLAVGGGSALDLTKAVAAVATQIPDVSVVDYLEGVGRGLIVSPPTLPWVALPTTGGTGSEVTKNAVISHQDPKFKKSLRSVHMLATLVLVDPELTVNVPANITAWTGLDAITQLIESYLCRNARPVTNAICLDGLSRAWPAIRQVMADGGSRPAREAMAHAALLSGLALANSGLGLAHGVAAALGATVGVAHGLACAVMLPTAVRFNRPAVESRVAKLARAAGVTTATNDALAADTFLAELEQLCADLNVPRQLRALGVRRDELEELVHGSHGNSLNGNPRSVSDCELRQLLEEQW